MENEGGVLGSGLFRFFSGIAIFGRGLQWFCSCRDCKFSGKVGNFLGEWLRFSLSIVWLRLLQAWVVKIFRKVAARIFQEVKIIGGGGQIVSGGVEIFWGVKENR